MLNIVESLRERMERKVRARFPTPESLPKLANILQEEWRKISLSIVRDSFMSSCCLGRSWLINTIVIKGIVKWYFDNSCITAVVDCRSYWRHRLSWAACISSYSGSEWFKKPTGPTILDEHQIHRVTVESNIYGIVSKICENYGRFRLPPLWYYYGML